MLKELIQNKFRDAGIVIVLRSENPELWKQGLLSLDYIPVDYMGYLIDYELAYRSKEMAEIQDLSVTILHDNRPSGVWPLSAGTDAFGKIVIGSNGGDIRPPLLAGTLPPRLARSISRCCLDLLKNACRNIQQSKIQSSYGFCGNYGMSDWHNHFMRDGATTILKHDLFLDLTPELEIIKSNFRKSYKALINSAGKIWNIELLKNDNVVKWNEFRELHCAVSGKITRSDKTWLLQHQAISNGNAFCIFLRDKSDKMIGGGFFETSRDEGVYGVGVFDRSLFDKPLGHVVQYHAIDEMKKRGIRWYKLGERSYPGDVPTPSEKMMSISDFKQGFSSHLFPNYLISLSIHHEVF